MELHILGSGSCAPSKDRACAGYLLKVKGKTFLLDAGPGTHASLCRLGFDFQSIDEIYISHIHVDHVGDLPAILFTRRHCTGSKEKDLPVIHGPEGFEADFFNIMGAYGTQIISGEEKYTIVEHTSESETYQTGLMYVKGLPMEHSIPTVGYRFEHLLNSKSDEDGSADTKEFEPDDFTNREELSDDDYDYDDEEAKPPPPEPVKALVYSGDTSPCENLIDLAQDADCFIMEISSNDSNPMRGHSTILQAAKVAEEAGAKITLFTHISPENDMESVERIASTVYNGMSIKAKDGMRLVI